MTFNYLKRKASAGIKHPASCTLIKHVRIELHIWDRCVFDLCSMTSIFTIMKCLKNWRDVWPVWPPTRQLWTPTKCLASFASGMQGARRILYPPISGRSLFLRSWSELDSLLGFRFREWNFFLPDSITTSLRWIVWRNNIATTTLRSKSFLIFKEIGYNPIPPYACAIGKGGYGNVDILLSSCSTAMLIGKAFKQYLPVVSGVPCQSKILSCLVRVMVFSERLDISGLSKMDR